MMKKDFGLHIVLRIILFIFLGVGVFFIPAWLTLVIATISAFVFPHYIELLVIGVVLDLVYAPGITKDIVAFSGWYTVISLGIYLCVRIFRKYATWYHTV